MTDQDEIELEDLAWQVVPKAPECRHPFSRLRWQVVDYRFDVVAWGRFCSRCGHEFAGVHIVG